MSDTAIRVIAALIAVSYGLVVVTVRVGAGAVAVRERGVARSVSVLMGALCTLVVFAAAVVVVVTPSALKGMFWVTVVVVGMLTGSRQLLRTRQT